MTDSQYYMLETSKMRDKERLLNFVCAISLLAAQVIPAAAGNLSINPEEPGSFPLGSRRLLAGQCLFL